MNRFDGMIKIVDGLEEIPDGTGEQIESEDEALGEQFIRRCQADRVDSRVTVGGLAEIG